MADPQDYTLVRMDDSIPDKAVLTYDALNDKITDSGLTALHGELQAASDSVSVGLQTMSSAGEQVIWENSHSSVAYAPPWHIIDRINPGGSSDRTYGPLEAVTRFADKSGIVTNPTNEVDVPKDEVIFDITLEFPAAREGVVFVIDYLDPTNPLNTIENHAWREIRDVSAGSNTIELQIPYALKTGTYFFSIFPVDPTEPPIEVVGNPQTGEFHYEVTFREFFEKPLATQEYVVATLTGGPADDVMLKSVYDKDDDGVVDFAGDAAFVHGAVDADPLTYYGQDASGAVGFHSLLGVLKNVNTTAYTDKHLTLTFDLLKAVPSSFIYIGSDSGSITLPELKTSAPHTNDVIIVANKATDAAAQLDVFTTGVDKIDDDKDALELHVGHSVVFVSHRQSRKWYTVASSGEPADIDEAAFKALQAQVGTQETAINGHGTQLADHANKIATNTANIKIAMEHSSSAMNEGLQNRKNAVNAIVAEVSNVHKTITLKLMSTTGLVDSALLDLSSWFSGGGVTPQPGDDHKIYYGFTVKTTLPEDEILRLGTSKEVSTINSLDVTLTRTGQTPNYMWIWLPDSAGTIKGFDFSGFVSNWGAVAINVAGVDGKLYVSPNKTSATSIEFEVKV